MMVSKLLGIKCVTVDWMEPGAFALASPNGGMTFYSGGKFKTYTATELDEMFDVAYATLLTFTKDDTP